MASSIGSMNAPCPACGSTNTIRVGGNEYQCPRWRCEPCGKPGNTTVFNPDAPMQVLKEVWDRFGNLHQFGVIKIVKDIVP